jgi:uncharacterized tellurite resistance protein B-like protein
MRGTNSDLPAIAIEARGLIPVNYTAKVDFVAVAIDVTDNKSGDHVLCTIPAFQWPDNLVFRSYQQGTQVSPSQGFAKWVEIGVAPVETLVAPKAGPRNLRFTAMAVRGASEQSNVKSLDVVAIAHTTFRTNLKGVGYKERGEKRLEAIKLSVRLGIAVAYADYNLDSTEAKVIKEWARKQLEQLPEDERESAKNSINGVIRYAGEKARIGQLRYEDVAAELRANPLPGIAMQALELCVQVMSADGKSTSNEMTIIRQIGNLLGVSHDDVRKLIDKNPPQTQSQDASGDLSDEDMVGLGKGLSNKETLVEIRKLFATYNARQTTESNHARRAHNQRMLEALARLRQKYAA